MIRKLHVAFILIFSQWLVFGSVICHEESHSQPFQDDPDPYQAGRPADLPLSGPALLNGLTASILCCDTPSPDPSRGDHISPNTRVDLILDLSETGQAGSALQARGRRSSAAEFKVTGPPIFLWTQVFLC